MGHMVNLQEGRHGEGTPHTPSPYPGPTSCEARAPRCGVGVPWGHLSLKKLSFAGKRSLRGKRKKGEHPHSPDRRIRAALPKSFLGCRSAWATKKQQKGRRRAGGDRVVDVHTPLPQPVQGNRFEKPLRTGQRHGAHGHPKDRPYENASRWNQRGAGYGTTGGVQAVGS